MGAPDDSKKSLQEVAATSFLKGKQTESSAKASLAQKRWTIRMGEETSLTSEALGTDALPQQPFQLQKEELPRQPTWAEKRFAIRTEDDRGAGCFAPGMDCQRSEESFIVPPVLLGGPPTLLCRNPICHADAQFQWHWGLLKLGTVLFC